MIYEYNQQQSIIPGQVTKFRDEFFRAELKAPHVPCFAQCDCRMPDFTDAYGCSGFCYRWANGDDLVFRSVREADLFHKDVPFEFVDEVMKVIEATPQHKYQLLTKRANLMHQYFTLKGFVPDNVWVGVTMEDAKANERLWYLKYLKYTFDAKVTYLSCEPLLGDLGRLSLDGIDWVIVGGESGSQARKMSKEWVLNIQRQCDEQDVPFFFKQWGTWGEDGEKRNKEANGNLLNGQLYQEWPKAWKGGEK